MNTFDRCADHLVLEVPEPLVLHFEQFFGNKARIPTSCRSDLCGNAAEMGDAVADAPVILVVEDEYLLHASLEEALKEGGFEPVFVRSYEDALDLLRSAPDKYKALVADINLHGHQSAGWGLARVARELNPEFPVVYMTAASAAEWSKLGVPGSILIQKPFAPAQLVTAISQLLNKGAPASG